MYMGAITIFLCVLGFFVLRSGLKWWVAGVSLLALMLGWGYHFMPASEFFFNYVPMYNKFRSVSMILVILQILLPMMGVLAANEILFGEDYPSRKERVKMGFCWALGLTAGMSALFALIPALAGSFISSSDGQLPGEIATALADDRAGLLRSDAFRSIFFILASAAVMWASCKWGKIKPVTAAIILAALALVDLWTIDKRYLNDSHFVPRREFKNNFAKRPVDEMILQDTDPHYRVLDLSVNTFNDAYISYHHKTIGGYSPAKLQRYQDLIEHNITREMGVIAAQMNGKQTIDEAQEAMVFCPVLSMLNTKYIILGGNIPPIDNVFRLGNAWFVNQIVPVENPNEEIATLATVNPATTAVVSKEFLAANPALAAAANAAVAEDGSQQEGTAAAAQAGTAQGGATASAPDNAVADMSLNNFIELASYAPNRLVYNYSSSKPQTVLFSEVYYNPGWEAVATNNATGEKMALDIFRANWILRGVTLPEGDFTVEMSFNPPSFSKGEMYSRISSGILLLMLVGGGIFYYLRKRKENE